MTNHPKKTTKANLKGSAHVGVSAGANVGKEAPKVELNETPPAAQKKATLAKHLRRDIVRCSACGKDHKRMLFILRKESSHGEYPYAGTCPLSGKQVLLKANG